MPAALPARVPLPDAVCALVSALLILLAGGWLLARLPALPERPISSSGFQLRWRMSNGASSLPGMPPRSDMPALVQAKADPSERRSGVLPAMVAAPSPADSPARPAAPTNLFDRAGRVQLPSEAVTAGVERRSSAQRVFEHRDDSAFEHPDRGVFTRAETVATAQSGAQRALFGRDVQAAQARPSPELAFNPRLHERPSDLADIDSPQAYLAAPIADKPSPGGDGQASALLLPEQTHRRDRALACRQPAVGWAWAALDRHLLQLQQAEQRMGHGSSPEERRHTLPQEIGRHYNLARRALWQLDRLLPSCARPGAG